MAGWCYRVRAAFAGLLWLWLISTVSAQNAADPVVIELDGQTVTRIEFDSLFNVAIRMLAAQQGARFSDQKPEQLAALRQQFLNQRANEMSLIREASRRNIQVSDEDIEPQFIDVLNKINADTGAGDEVDEILLRRLLKDKQQATLLSEQLLDEIEVRPGEVVVLHHDVQDSLATPEQICLRHIVVADLGNANRLLAELKAGADFAELARLHSTESMSAKNGGDVGCFAREHMIPRSEFERAAFNSKVGQLAGPVSSDFGYHLLIVYERQPPRVPTLNEVYKDLEKEIRHERLPNKLIEIRDESGVVTYPDRLGG